MASGARAFGVVRARSAALSESKWITAVKRDRSTLLGALLVIGSLLVAALPYIVPLGNPNALHPLERLQAPSLMHPMGTDDLGRDILLRVVYGASTSILVGLQVVTIAFTIGVAIGGLAGFVGGKVDWVLMRLADVFLAFPALVLAIAVSAALGPSLFNASLAVGIVWAPRYARLMRVLVAQASQNQYVEASIALGASPLRSFSRHIFPNTAGPLIAQGTLDVGYAILYIAALSFMGVGAAHNVPEWGAMITAGRRYLLDYWWYSTMPGVAIFLTVQGFMLLGDGLRDALDPKA